LRHSAAECGARCASAETRAETRFRRGTGFRAGCYRRAARLPGPASIRQRHLRVGVFDQWTVAVAARTAATIG
jgi:hypothetical protein